MKNFIEKKIKFLPHTIRHIKDDVDRMMKEFTSIGEFTSYPAPELVELMETREELTVYEDILYSLNRRDDNQLVEFIETSIEYESRQNRKLEKAQFLVTFEIAKNMMAKACAIAKSNGKLKAYRACRTEYHRSKEHEQATTA